MRSNNFGLSVLELVMVCCLAGLILTCGVSGVGSFKCRTRISNGTRMVTAAMNAARYMAIEGNKAIKLTIRENRLILLERSNKDWLMVKSYKADTSLRIKMNAQPVFSPSGIVSPLCSVLVSNERYSYKITISFAGRIKVKKI